MKTNLSKFQLSKEEMGKLQGGAQLCHCGGSDNWFTVTGSDEYDDLESTVGKICGEDGWSCNKIKDDERIKMPS